MPDTAVDALFHSRQDIYFIVDEIDSCETIYSTKEGGPEHTAFIHVMPKLIYLYY